MVLFPFCLCKPWHAHPHFSTLVFLRINLNTRWCANNTLLELSLRLCRLSVSALVMSWTWNVHMEVLVEWTSYEWSSGGSLFIFAAISNKWFLVPKIYSSNMIQLVISSIFFYLLSKSFFFITGRRKIFTCISQIGEGIG